MKTPTRDDKWGNPDWVRRIAFDDLERRYTAAMEENARLREALDSAVGFLGFMLHTRTSSGRQFAERELGAHYKAGCATLAHTQNTAKAGGVK